MDSAIIPIIGPICKYQSTDPDDAGTSTIVVQTAIQAALDDAGVDKVVLYIDSPGGTVEGTSDLADFIFAARSEKPIVAYVSDNCQSAAYWVASQCDSIFANAGASIGSIGIFKVLIDSSEAAKAEGVTLTLVSAGEYKGLGTPGLPVDDKAVEEARRSVASASQLFIDAITRGRGFDATPLADGRLYSATESLALGMIDGIGAMGDVV